MQIARIAKATATRLALTACAATGRRARLPACALEHRCVPTTSRDPAINPWSCRKWRKISRPTPMSVSRCWRKSTILSPIKHIELNHLRLRGQMERETSWPRGRSAKNLQNWRSLCRGRVRGDETRFGSNMSLPKIHLFDKIGERPTLGNKNSPVLPSYTKNDAA